jgi:hypothetical protein
MEGVFQIFSNLEESILHFVKNLIHYPLKNLKYSSIISSTSFHNKIYVYYFLSACSDEISNNILGINKIRNLCKIYKTMLLSAPKTGIQQTNNLKYVLFIYMKYFLEYWFVKYFTDCNNILSDKNINDDLEHLFSTR